MKIEGIVVFSSPPITTSVSPPASWLNTTTAIAPAADALLILSTKLQFPRLINAIELAKSPVVKALQPSKFAASISPA